MTRFKNYVEKNDHWFGIRPWSRHSLVLAVAGLVYIFLGYTYMVTTSTPERMLALKAGTGGFMSIDAWGVIFIIVGVGAIISARWPPFAESWGYMALTGLSAAWASVYGLSIIFYDAPLGGATITIAWSLIAFLWWSISGLMNPTQVVLADGQG